MTTSPVKKVDGKNKEVCVSSGFLKKLRRYFFNKLNIKIRCNSRHKVDKLLDALVFMACRNVAAEEGTRLLKTVLPDELVPSADRVLARLKQLSLEQLQRVFFKALDRSVKDAKHLFTKPVMVAVDLHDIPYFGDRNNIFVVGTKRKLGTNYAFSFATIEIVENGKRFCLGAIPVKQGDEKSEMLKDLIKKAKSRVTISLILADRGFFNVKCINALKASKTRFIVPAIRDTKVKRVMQENKTKLPTIVIYTMAEKKKEQATFNLAMKWMEKKGDKPDEVIGFATNIQIDFDNTDIMKEKVEWIAETYRDRWSIETGYRVKKDFRAKTTTRKTVVRHFYFFLSVLLFNLWTLFNAMQEKHFTTETVKFAMEWLSIEAFKKPTT